MKAGFSREEISEANNPIAMLAEVLALLALTLTQQATQTTRILGQIQNTIFPEHEGPNRDSLPSLVYIDANEAGHYQQNPDDPENRL